MLLRAYLNFEYLDVYVRMNVSHVVRQLFRGEGGVNCAYLSLKIIVPAFSVTCITASSSYGEFEAYIYSTRECEEDRGTDRGW